MYYVTHRRYYWPLLFISINLHGATSYLTRDNFHGGKVKIRKFKRFYCLPCREILV